MVFSSPLFLSVFLPLLLLCTFVLRRHRAAVLTVGSLLFYSWGEPRALAVMLAAVLFNYGIALALGGAVRRNQSARAKLLLTLGVGIDLAILVVYKFLSFVIGKFNLAAAPLGFTLNDPAITLPVGISFYLFQIISYLTDVYRGEVAPEKSLLSFTL